MTEEKTNELQLQQRENPWVTPLDNLGEECPENPHIDWFSTENPEDLEIAKCDAEILVMNPEVEDDNTSKWQTLVPEHLHKFGDIFSKKKSERMPVCKPYDHGIDFVKNTFLPKPAKLYLLSPKEHNSLDKWI